MDVLRRNLELKARDPDPAASLAAARALGARDEGVLRQRDTYFAAPRGRLKLREQEPGGAQLIAYERTDVPSARESRYRLVDVPDPEALRAALDAALGTTGVVRKRRRLLLSENVRIHLDDVDGLGAFVELEAVVPDGGDPGAEAERVTALREALGLGDDRLEPRGYAALLQEGAGPRPVSRPVRPPSPTPPARRWAGPTRRSPASPSVRRSATSAGSSTPVPTSRTAPIRRGSARRPPRSASSSPPAAPPCARSP